MSMCCEPICPNTLLRRLTKSTHGEIVASVSIMNGAFSYERPYLNRDRYLLDLGFPESMALGIKRYGKDVFTATQNAAGSIHAWRTYF